MSAVALRMPAGSAAELIREGDRVHGPDGLPVGRVKKLLSDTLGRLQHLVVRRGRLFHRDIVVPAGWIAAVSPAAITLTVPVEQLRELPLYRPDAELQRDINAALDRDLRVRATNAPVRAHVQNRVARLGGHAGSSYLAQRAERIARSVRGVQDVENRITVDDDLKGQITLALLKHPRTRALRGVRFLVRDGIAELTGAVPAVEDARLLEEVVASVPAVRAVATRLYGFDNASSRVLQPSIGHAIFDGAGGTGRVASVIIDPRSRRVQAVVASGVESGARLIPVEDVDRVTAAGVLLRAPLEQAAAYTQYDYTAPPQEWRPPFPYEREDVLFLRERARPATGEGPTTINDRPPRCLPDSSQED